jgi:hypothetical protein
MQIQAAYIYLGRKLWKQEAECMNQHHQHHGKEAVVLSLTWPLVVKRGSSPEIVATLAASAIPVFFRLNSTSCRKEAGGLEMRSRLNSSGYMTMSVLKQARSVCCAIRPLHCGVELTITMPRVPW